MKNDLQNEVNKKKIKSYNTITAFEIMTYATKPEHLAHWAMWTFGDSRLKVQYKLANFRYTPARAYRPTNHGAVTRACVMHELGRGTNCIYAYRALGFWKC